LAVRLALPPCDGREEIDAVIAFGYGSGEPLFQKHTASAIHENMDVLGKLPGFVEHLASHCWILSQYLVEQLLHRYAVWEIEVDELAAYDVSERGVEIHAHERLLVRSGALARGISARICEAEET
jgi:hypothetical protein